MNSRWVPLVSLSLVVFASLVITWQFLHYDDMAALREWIAHGRSGGKPGEISSSLFQSYLRGKQLAEISDIVKRDQIIVPAGGLCRYVDLVLPPDARVFMKDMTGITNADKIRYYYYLTYYLFPREVGVSVDHITRITRDGFLGQTSGSDQEILTNGYDATADFPPEGTLTLQLLRPLSELPLKEPATPAWFNSTFDTMAALLLPLLTALAGMWLVRFLFPGLSERMPLPEQLACGLGLGMMAVAALTLGVKLCGFHGRGLILFVTALGSVAEIWHHHKTPLAKIVGGYGKTVKSPITIVILAAGSLVFLILFRLAGLQGLVDPDALTWMLKAKIMHLYTGHELVQWFSNPRLAYAHLDYPTLVPSLHSATYDSLGHVDEFVTKFWPAWMLLFLIGALSSLNRGGNNWRHVTSFVLLGLLLLPVTQSYAQMEGGTLPIIFFTVMGFVQCALWLVGKDRARLGLGLTLLFGAAMAKFEGFIFLALAGGWMLLVPSARPSLKPSPRLWRVPAFWFLAALPFVCLRIQIPVLHFESGWAGYALHNPWITLLNCPWIFMILFARLFVNPDFANWNGEEQLHWIGRWDGMTSLYNHSTLGLAWFCLLLTVALWFAIPARRPIIIWMLAMLVGALAAFSMVFASLFNVLNLVSTIDYARDDVAGRYLLPILLAWFTTFLTLFFADLPSSTSTLAPGTAATDPSASVGSPGVVDAGAKT